MKSPTVFLVLWWVGMLIVSEGAQEDKQSSTEEAAGDAIKQLLKEKISQKFKEAANEVKGVLVKHLGASLENAHTSLNENSGDKKVEEKKETNAGKYKPNTKVFSGKSKTHKPLLPGIKPCGVECRLKKTSRRLQCRTCQLYKARKAYLGAAVHLHKGPRQRKFSGPAEIPKGAPAPHMNLKLHKKPAQQKASAASKTNTQPSQMNVPPMDNVNMNGPNNMLPPPQNNMGMNVGMVDPIQQPCVGGMCAPMPCGPSCVNNCCAMNQVPGPNMCPMNCNINCLPFCPTQCCKGMKKSSVTKSAKKKQKKQKNKKE